MEKDLRGQRLELRQRVLAETQARDLAGRMVRKTNEPWQGFVDVYTV